MILMVLSLQFKIELGNDYTTLMYMMGGVILSIGLSVLDNKINGEIIYGVENKANDKT